MKNQHNKQALQNIIQHALGLSLLRYCKPYASSSREQGACNCKTTYECYWVVCERSTSFVHHRNLSERHHAGRGSRRGGRYVLRLQSKLRINPGEQDHHGILRSKLDKKQQNSQHVYFTKHPMIRIFSKYHFPKNVRKTAVFSKNGCFWCRSIGRAEPLASRLRTWRSPERPAILIRSSA